MIVILWDSLRIDTTEPLKGIFEKESWSQFKTVAGFTAPVVASLITGKTPEELGLNRNTTDFWATLPPEKIDDILFDYFDKYISIGRLIGPPTQCTPEPPVRRDMRYKFLHPIPWNAVSNWDIDIFRYVGMKWSSATDDWWDLIYWHSFVTHGPWSIYDSMGAAESPEVINTDRLMARLAERNPKKLRDWYMKGVYYAAETLRALNDITGGNETIICFADHGEALGEEINGRKVTGHFSGMHKHPILGTVPVWINREEKIPDDISHLTLKEWIRDMYIKYERDNPEYQKWKSKFKK